MQPFTELGTLVESRWRDQNYNEELFPGIAAQALTEMNPSGRVDPWEIIRWVHTTPDLPQQMDLEANFGDPPLTLYVGSRFYIDVYFGSMAPRASINIRFPAHFKYCLEAAFTRTIGSRRIGRSTALLDRQDFVRDVSCSREGYTRDKSRASVHSFALSSGKTIRHDHDQELQNTMRAVQFSYYKPFLAYDPFFTDGSLKRKVQTVELLLKMKHPEADRIHR